MDKAKILKKTWRLAVPYVKFILRATVFIVAFLAFFTLPSLPEYLEPISPLLANTVYKFIDIPLFEHLPAFVIYHPFLLLCLCFFSLALQIIYQGHLKSGKDLTLLSVFIGIGTWSASQEFSWNTRKKVERGLLESATVAVLENRDICRRYRLEEKEKKSYLRFNFQADDLNSLLGAAVFMDREVQRSAKELLKVLRCASSQPAHFDNACAVVENQSTRFLGYLPRWYQAHRIRPRELFSDVCGNFPYWAHNKNCVIMRHPSMIKPKFPISFAEGLFERSNIYGEVGKISAIFKSDRYWPYVNWEWEYNESPDSKKEWTFLQSCGTLGIPDFDGETMKFSSHHTWVLD